MIRFTKLHLFLLIVLLIAESAFLTACSQKSTETVSFSKDVFPILKSRCFECHTQGGEGYKASGLNMETYADLMKGTKFGPVIKPHDSLSSTLMILVEGRADPSIKMPHGKREPLTKDQIQTIGKWIDEGAKNN
jgi:uncharacterized membrane protein